MSPEPNKKRQNDGIILSDKQLLIHDTSHNAFYTEDAENIIGFNSLGGHTSAIIFDRKCADKHDLRIVISKDLNHIQETLSCFSFFCRVSNRWLINVKHIKSIIKGEHTLTLDNGDSLSIGVDFRKNFYNCFLRL